MSDAVAINIAGQEILHNALSAEKIKERANDALEVIINDAAGLLSEETTRRGLVYLGMMKGAWLQTIGLTSTAMELTAFSDPTPTAPYAWTVIYGRKPGKMPPPIALLPWVWKKLGVQGMAARGVAWNIARKIGRHGTKPNDIITPVVAANINDWQKILEGAIRG